MPASHEKLVRTVRLDDARIAAMLDRLEAKTGQDRPDRDKRRCERFSYRIKGCVVHMQQPGAVSPTPYLVPTRDLSETGLAFLHGGFVHTGSQCAVQLITSHGSWQTVKAMVVRCRFVEGHVHEVGVRFDETIRPADYAPAAAHCRVLLVDDDPLVARLATFHLQQLNAEVDVVTNGQEAVEKALEHPYDLILMDMMMPVMDGLTAVAQLRRRGYTHLIVALTALTQPEERQHCLDAGCDGHIGKPFQREDLVRLVASLRREPLTSSLRDEPGMAELVEAFLEELPAKLHELEEAVTAGDTERVINLARLLKAEGSSYGFEPISTGAAEVEDALINRQPLAETRKPLDDLVSLCLRARSSSQAKNRPEAEQQSGPRVHPQEAKILAASSPAEPAQERSA